jgi:predicted RNA methylase
VFDADPSEAIGAVVETGEFVDPKKLYQFFETPPELAARLVEMAAIEPGMKVLEPSAGKGAIAGAVVEVMPDHVHQLICVEVNPSMAERLRERFTVMEADFLGVTFRPERLFERVVMNPPFAGQADIDHVRHAFDLPPGLAGARTVQELLARPGGVAWWRDNGVRPSAGDAFAKFSDLAFRAHLTHEIRNGCLALGLQIAQKVIQLLADACDFGVCLLAELSNDFIPTGDVALRNRCGRSR